MRTVLCSQEATTNIDDTIAVWRSYIGRQRDPRSHALAIARFIETYKQPEQLAAFVENKVFADAWLKYAEKAG